MHQNLAESLPKFEEITEQVGRSFDSIEFSNFKDQDEEFISVIDANYSEEFQNAVSEIEATKKVY